MAFVKERCVAVRTPLCNVSCHVLEPPRVRTLLPDFPGDATGVPCMPCIAVKICVCISEPPPALGPCPRSIFPLGLAWEAVFPWPATQYAFRFRVETVDKGSDVIPRHGVHRPQTSRPAVRKLGWIVSRHQFPLLLSDRPCAQRVRLIDRARHGWALVATALGGRTPAEKMTRAKVDEIQTVRPGKFDHACG